MSDGKVFWTTNKKWVAGIILPSLLAFFVSSWFAEEKPNLKVIVNSEMYALPSFAEIPHGDKENYKEVSDSLKKINLELTDEKLSSINNNQIDIKNSLIGTITSLEMFKNIVFLRIINKGGKVAEGIKMQLPELAYFDYFTPHKEGSSGLELKRYHEFAPLSPTHSIYVRLFFKSDINENWITVTHDYGVGSMLIKKEFGGVDRYFAEQWDFLITIIAILLVGFIVLAYLEFKKS